MITPAPNLSTSTTKIDAAEKRAREVAAEIIEAVDEVRQRIEVSCDYVGDRFAEEARRIHYGEVEQREIFGEATDEESMELDEEGIEYFRYPWIPRRSN